MTLFRQPFDRFIRWRIVANVDSTGLWSCEDSASESLNPSRTHFFNSSIDELNLAQALAWLFSSFMFCAPMLVQEISTLFASSICRIQSPFFISEFRENFFVLEI